MRNYNNNYNKHNFSRSPGPGPNSPGPGPGPGFYRSRPRRSPGPGGSGLNELISWVIDVGMLFVCFPLGLVLTISHAMGSNWLSGLVGSILGQADKSTAKRRSYTQPADRYSGHAYHRASERVAQAEDAAGAEAGPAEKAEQEQSRRSEKREGLRRVDSGSGVLAVVGWILVALGLVLALSVSGLWSLLTTLAVALGGGAMVLASSAARRKERKYRRCITVSGEHGVVDIARLRSTMGLEKGAMEKLLTDMVERGYYGERAYIDHQRDLLVIDPEEMRDVYRREDEAKKTEAQRAQEERMSEYERIVEQIRQADLDIADEAMSEKIRRMQASTAAIFREVEAHPEKKSQIERFMNYYLPTTLKLLDAYARIEQQGVSGQNMAKAKADIERIAETLAAGYEKQLDTLYTADAVDIAGDVSVIENMMRRDGLSGKSDFDLRNAGGSTAGGH